MFRKLGSHITVLSYGFAILGLACVFFVAQLNPLDGIQGGGVVRFLGRFHPLVLHFPVTCLVLAGVFEFLGGWQRLAFLRRLVGPMLFFAALSAIITVVLGLLLAANEGHQGALIDRHRLLGISVSVLACLSFVLFVSAQYSNLTKFFTLSYRVSLFSAVSVMGLAAHDGGSLVHGPNYLAEHSPAFLLPILAPDIIDDVAQEPVISNSENDEKQFISPATLERFDSEVGQFIGGYCSRCHGEGKQEANLRLDQLDPSFQHFNSQHAWQRVLGALGSHQMPPKDAKQPSDRQRMLAIDWIHKALEEHAYVRRADMANTPLRRLNKRELNNTYQDLFKVDADFVSRLPKDPKSEHGYDNDAELLMVSMSDLKAYHGIARQAIQRYVHFGVKASKTDKYFVEMEDVYHFGRSEGNYLSYKRSGQPLSVEKIKDIKLTRQTHKPIYRDRIYGPLPYGNIPIGKSSAGEGRGFARLHEQFMLLQTSQTVGEVVVKVHAAMQPGRAGDNSLPRLRLEAGWRNSQSLRVKNVGEYDITANLDKPQVVEFRFRLEDIIEPKMARGEGDGDNRWILLVLSNVARHENGIFAASIYGQSDLKLPSAPEVNEVLVNQTKKAEKQQVKGIAAWQRNGVPTLHFDALEAEVIPVKSAVTTPFTIKYPGKNATLAVQKRTLKNTLVEFLPIVFRKEHISELEYDVYLNLFESLRNSGESFKNAVSETLAAALISPSFLYIGYSQNEQEKMLDPVAYGNHYLVSRLSYYLWSSMPDKTLRQLAASNKLSDPAVLAEQVERMLADDRAERFTDVFAKQWLQLAKLKGMTISKEHYPEFGAELGEFMAQESVMTFQDNFHQNRDARELYFSEFMMINQQLARIYQVPNVNSGDIKRVHTGISDKRMGLLTQASVLTMNSDGEDSHPIKRGVWMLERLLDDPPPPPPPSVPELDTNNPLLAGLSLKQKIEQHRELSGCSGCHEKIDPWGLLMENYDATGKWRTQVNTYEKVELEKEARKKKYLKNELKLISSKYDLNVINTVQVDTSSILPDGTMINTLPEFSTYLQTNKQTQLMKALVVHMMMYALGRELDILDEQESEVIYSTFRASGYKLSALTKAIIQSDGFTNRAQFSINEVH